MKIRSAIFAGIMVIAAISITSAIYDSGQSEQENKIRVAFFPNVGHVVPIVGLETGIFADGLGNQILIEPKIFDSGPQVIEAMFANSVDIAYVGPGPAINGFLKSEKHDVKILAGAASGGASFVIPLILQLTLQRIYLGKELLLHKLVIPKISLYVTIFLKMGSYLRKRVVLLLC